MNAYVYKRKAQYHETDKMGIIHHSNYIKWMEEARIEYMDSLGCGYREAEESGVFSPVVSLSAEYLRPVGFGDEVEVRVSIEKYNGASLGLSYEFFNVTKNEICTKAESKHCFIMNGRVVLPKKTLPELDEKLRSETE